jgi:hypothetical protein
MNYEDKRVPLNLVCRYKNKQRLTDFLNKIIDQFEINGMTEQDITAPKEVKVIVEKPYYVFFRPSAKINNEFKSLYACFINNDFETLKNHF